MGTEAQSMDGIGALRKLPVGIQSFGDIRDGGYLYADKTPYIWRLVESGKAYFLSRPRRFGKSLFISTLEAYFQGRRDLFDGLAIQPLEDARGDAAWTAYPIIHFALSGGEYQTPRGLEDALEMALRQTMDQYGIGDVPGETIPMRFASLIRALHAATGRRVVVLVDEYDSPLLDTMVNYPEQEELNRQLFKGFFGILKNEDAHLKFVFFTGVTRFSKVSIFSDLNQLNDISMDDAYSRICGITQEELEQNFTPEIARMAENNDQSEAECLDNLKRMYDGYRFSKHGENVYNPFSLLKAFYAQDYDMYWFETGTPSFLIKGLKESGITVEEFADGMELDPSELRDYQADSGDPMPLFYQTGYLTIDHFDTETGQYALRFPNAEVKYGFLNSLAKATVGGAAVSGPFSARRFVVDLRKGDVASMMARMQSLFASIPYAEGAAAKSYEQEWRNEVYLVLSLMGQTTQCEVHSSQGRADCVVGTHDYLYVFEFKLDRPASEALEQIGRKGYATPYEADGRQVIKVGVSFSSDTRTIAEWQVA